MTINTFDDAKIKKLLKECDPYLLKYVNALKHVLETQKDLTNTAMTKIREQAQRLSELREELNK